MKKYLILIIFSFFTSLIYSQSSIIEWRDTSGRSFEIVVPKGDLSYGMISGDRIEYGNKYSDNPGKVVKVGNVRIEYGGKYSDNPGKVVKVGNVRIEYGGKYSDNPGKVVKVGGVRIEYESKYSDNPGMIKSITGKVINNW